MLPPIRCARPEDLGRLDAGLRALSHVLGHRHRAEIGALATAGFGPDPAFVALVADSGATDLAGLALASPLFSTVRGMAGVHVSDLWVSASWRGQGLGVRLLAAARDEGERRWQAGFLRLEAARGNARAIAFYERLGFTGTPDQNTLTLTGAALSALEGAP